MLNKEEVKYNVKSLISTWLYGVKDIPDLILILTNEVVSQLYSALIDNAEKYTKATLIGIVGEKDKKFGELDIV